LVNRLWELGDYEEDTHTLFNGLYFNDPL